MKRKPASYNDLSNLNEGRGRGRDSDGDAVIRYRQFARHSVPRAIKRDRLPAKGNRRTPVVDAEIAELFGRSTCGGGERHDCGRPCKRMEAGDGHGCSIRGVLIIQNNMCASIRTDCPGRQCYAAGSKRTFHLNGIQHHDKVNRLLRGSPFSYSH